MKTYSNSVVLRNDGIDPSSLKTDLNAGITKTITVRVATLPTPGLGSLASLFDINSGAIANPMTTTDNGNYVFKVTDGQYDIIIEEGTANEIIEPSIEIIEIPSAINLINNLSQAYEFATVAEYKAFATAFPVGKVIHLLDRQAEFTVISGTGTANTFNIIASDQVSQSIDLEVNGIVNVNQWGATGDGVTDDTAVIQAAIDSGATNIILNPGTYITSANIVLGLRQSFNGNSNNQFDVVIRPTIAVTRAIDFMGGCDIKHLTLDMVDTLNATGLYAGKGTLAIGNVMIVEDVLIETCLGTGFAIQVQEVVGIDFTNVRAVDCDTGMRILGQTGSLPTYMSFTNCAFRGGGLGVSILRGYGITFNNCLFEDNSLEAVRIDVLDRVERVLFRNCWFERNFQSSATDYNVVVDGTNPGAIAEDITFNNNFFYEASVSKTAHFIKVRDARWNGNTQQSTAATVLFDAGTTGWVSEQPDNFANGALVNAGGSIVEELVSSAQGTWTATHISSGNVTGIPTFSNGTYVKTGKQVTLWGSWSVDVTTALVDVFVQMAGIPFNTATATSHHVGTCTLTANSYSMGTVDDASGANSDRMVAGMAAALVVTNGVQTLDFTVTYETS